MIPSFFSDILSGWELFFLALDTWIGSQTSAGCSEQYQKFLHIQFFRDINGWTDEKSSIEP